jgi:SagB-type dehydrogenase family enzyme
MWEGSEFILENYLTGTRSSTSPVIVKLLDSVASYEDFDAILGGWKAIPHSSELLNKLIEGDLLVEEDSALAEKEDRVADWAWGHDARYFHYSSNAAQFEIDPSIQRHALILRANEIPPPSPFKDYEGVARSLGRDFDGRSGGLWDVLKGRRTCRSFSGEPISAEQLGDILLWTWGKTDSRRYPMTGDLILKTSPSGGARHAIETYPVVLNVGGVSPGIYHYSVRRDDLVLLREGSFPALVSYLCSDHPWIRKAAVVFFMTAIVERSAWKYRHSHAYRVLHLDAGHLGQTFHLVCNALGLGPFTFAATRNSDIEQALGLDGVSEIALYTAAVGVPDWSS